MSILPILKYGEKILRRPAKKVDDIIVLDELIRDMLETMYANSGIGLAANQVGSEWQVLVLDLKAQDKKNPLVLINPVIKECRGKDLLEEGCLSFPGIYIPVRRFIHIRVTGLGRRGQPLDFSAEGPLARVIQHEYDHLQGKVFIDRLPIFKKLAVLTDIRRRRKQGQW